MNERCNLKFDHLLSVIFGFFFPQFFPILHNIPLRECGVFDGYYRVEIQPLFLQDAVVQMSIAHIYQHFIFFWFDI